MKRSFFRNKLATLGFAIIVIVAFSALFAPVISPYSPTDQDLPGNLRGPELSHPFGQDKLGRDIFSRVVYGSRISLYVGTVTVAFSLFIGLIVGSIAGYYGGKIDEAFMRVVDVLMAFPGLLLAIAIIAALGPALNHVVLALVITGWVGYARIIRGQILAAREEEYVLAARSLGAGPFRVIVRHLLPNIIAPIIVEATFGMAGAIIAEAGLSFLGLGTPPPAPSWGAMLAEGRQFLLAAPHITIFPGLAIMTVVLALNFIGDGLRDFLDVKGNV